MTDKKPTQLYRHYDENGTLLYVGVSISAMLRFSQHKHESSWYRQIKRQEIETFNSRKEALEAETRAIRTEKPLYNIRKKLKPLPFKKDKYDAIATAFKEALDMQKENNIHANTLAPTTYKALPHDWIATPFRHWCKIVGISPSHAYAMAASGKLKITKFGNRSLITRVESDRYFNQEI